jgi:hypothetical protein
MPPWAAGNAAGGLGGGMPSLPSQAAPAAAQALASQGQNGDNMVAHINPAEAMMLRAAGGSGTINPRTGLPQFDNPSLVPLMSQAPGGNLFGSRFGAVPSWALQPYQLGMQPSSFPTPGVAGQPLSGTAGTAATAPKATALPAGSLSATIPATAAAPGTPGSLTASPAYMAQGPGQLTGQLTQAQLAAQAAYLALYPQMARYMPAFSTTYTAPIYGGTGR